MAIGFGRAIAAALAGTTKGLAEAAEKEDEKRDELTKITLAQKIKNIEKAQELSRKRDEEIAAETEAVDALMGFKIQGQQVSRAQATRAYRMYGNNAPEILRQGLIQFEDTGFIEEVKTPARMGAVEETEALIADGGGLFGKGRGESVSRDLKNTLSAMGYDPSGVEIAQKAKVVGAQVVSGPGAMKRESEYFYSDLPGHEMVEKVTITDPTDPNKVTTQFLSLDGSDVTDRVKVGTTKLTKNADTLYPDLDFGLAWEIKPDGSVQSLNQDIAFDKRTGERYLRDSEGQFTIPVRDKNIVTLTSSQIEALGGADGVSDRFDVLGKDGRKAFKEYNEQAESFEYLVKIFDEQLALLDIHGDSLVAPVGSVSEWVEFAKVNLKVGIEVVQDAAGELGIDFEGVDIGRIAEESARFERELQEATDPEAKLAIARKLYTSRQIVAAYYYAKSTGDTRISNQDFDQFLKTVQGGSEASQRAMYKARLSEAQTALTSKYTTFSSYLPPASSTKRSDQEARNALLESIPESRQPATIASTIDRMFDPKVETKTTTEIVEEIEEAEKTASKYNIKLTYVLPDGTPTDNTDPNGIAAYVVYQGKNIATTGTGQPIYFESETSTKEDAERDLMLLIQKNVLQ